MKLYSRDIDRDTDILGTQSGTAYPYCVPCVIYVLFNHSGVRAEIMTLCRTSCLWVGKPLTQRRMCIARPTVTMPASDCQYPLTGTKLYCLATEAHRFSSLHMATAQWCPARTQSHDLWISSVMLHRQCHHHHYNVTEQTPLTHR